jgi:hypothetical protein
MSKGSVLPADRVPSAHRLPPMAGSFTIAATLRFPYWPVASPLLPAFHVVGNVPSPTVRPNFGVAVAP